MLSAGLVFGREVLRDTMALPRLLANGDVAQATLASAVVGQIASASVGEESAVKGNETTLVKAEASARAEGGAPENEQGYMPLPPSRSDLL